MANQAFLSFPLPVEATKARARALPRSPAPSLAGVELHRSVRVVALLLDDETGAWLRAVGIAEGERIVPLRRAAFGGPIHVRTESGGEFALHRALAKAILVREDSETAA
jgi:ferrous iron transport protein A